MKKIIDLDLNEEHCLDGVAKIIKDDLAHKKGTTVKIISNKVTNELTTPWCVIESKPFTDLDIDMAGIRISFKTFDRLNSLKTKHKTWDKIFNELLDKNEEKK